MYRQCNVVHDDNDQENNASISGKPATDLKTKQSRLIQWVIYTDQCQQTIKEHIAHKKLLQKCHGQAFTLS